MKLVPKVKPVFVKRPTPSPERSLDIQAKKPGFAIAVFEIGSLNKAYKDSFEAPKFKLLPDTVPTPLTIEALPPEFPAITTTDPAGRIEVYVHSISPSPVLLNLSVPSHSLSNGMLLGCRSHHVANSGRAFNRMWLHGRVDAEPDI